MPRIRRELLDVHGAAPASVHASRVRHGRCKNDALDHKLEGLGRPRVAHGMDWEHQRGLELHQAEGIQPEHVAQPPAEPLSQRCGVEPCIAERPERLELGPFH
jgi:hypothetical protein